MGSDVTRVLPRRQPRVILPASQPSWRTRVASSSRQCPDPGEPSASFFHPGRRISRALRPDQWALVLSLPVANGPNKDMAVANHSYFDLTISNYKSIASLDIKGLQPFSVFAGPNGCGKSNFFDALDFVGRICRHGVEDALRAHGGADNVRSAKLYAPGNQHFKFGIKLFDEPPSNPAEVSRYDLQVRDFATAPGIEESLSQAGRSAIRRVRGKPTQVGHEKEPMEVNIPSSMSALFFSPGHPLTHLLTNITVYRVDPRSAKEPDPSDADPSRLNGRGNNLAAVLGRLEADPEAHALISEWMAMVVPGVEAIQTTRQRLDQRTAVLFKERHTKRRFPAGLMSDGTIYALSLLVAVLDRRDSPGVTLIEEPERGLHPSAIAEFVDFLRNWARPENPIWVTTHSESVVRKLQLEELVVVDKKRGRTNMKQASSGNLDHTDLEAIGLDTAWLSNLLHGGVPW